MRVTAEQLISFVVNHGDEYGVTMKDIELVGLDECISGASCCNAACERNATEHSIFSCYFSRNFKCHLRNAIAYNNAEYIIHVVEYFGGYDDEYGYDYEPMGGGTIYCNSYEEMQDEVKQLQDESDIGYRVCDKSGKTVSVFRYRAY